MSLVFISVIVVTIIQVILCHSVRWFLLSFLVSFIARTLFMGRLIGATVKVKALMITEAFSIGMLVLFNILSKSNINYIGLLLYILLSALCCLIMFIDDTFFLYITEDVENQEE